MADTAQETQQTHHFSDIDTWKNPDRNFFVFVIMSVLFGFLGFDHFYLRSFATGTQKLIFNLLTFGMWYWWDLIQILKDGTKVRKDGLNSPFDWVRGIGRGVFTPLNSKESDPVYVPKKSYLVYAILAIFFGWLGADKFYIGEFLQGCVKLFSCFNIFIFLFGWLWVLWDGFHAFFLMEGVLKDGISAPIPYSMLFSETAKGDMFLVTDIYDKSQEAQAGALDWITKSFPLPSVPVFPWRELYRELVVPFMTPPLVKAVQGVKATPCGGAPEPPIIPPITSVLPTLENMAKNSPPGMLVRSVIAPETIDGRSSMEQAASSIGQPSTGALAMPSLGAPAMPSLAAPAMPSLAAPAMPSLAAPAMPSLAAPAMPSLGAPAMPSLGAPAIQAQALPISPATTITSPISALTAPLGLKTQGGGASSGGGSGSGGGSLRDDSAGPGPVIAGALTAVVLAGGLKGFYDVINKQYG